MSEWAERQQSRSGGWPYNAFLLAAHFGQDPKAFKGRYTRPELAQLLRDYLVSHPEYRYKYID